MAADAKFEVCRMMIIGVALAVGRAWADAWSDVTCLEVAGWEVSDRTLWSLAREGLVPCRRVGKQYRLSRNVLVRWIQNGEGQA